MRALFVMVLVVVAFPIPVAAQDVVFYDGFESGDTAGWWAPARVGETGQTTCYGEAGEVIDCTGTGQDGDIQPGKEWPNPRFVDNTDGTVTDKLTGLIWLRDARCEDLAGTDPVGRSIWTTALTAAAALASGTCGLTEGSSAGDLRLPSVNDLQSLIHYEYSYPALPDAEGTAKWSEGDAFSGVQAEVYWSSTSNAASPTSAWVVHLRYGSVNDRFKSFISFVWPVRGGL